MSTFDFSVDVDEVRCDLLEATNEALGLADDLADAVDHDRSGDAHRLASNFRQVRARMRTLRTVLRVEEGRR